MRTTLKRVIGRGAVSDGNGRAVLPPSATTPMTLYRQPERRRRTGLQLVGRILLWLLIAVLVVAAGLLGGAYLYFHEQVKAVQAHTPEGIRAEKGLDVPQAACTTPPRRYFNDNGGQTYNTYATINLQPGYQRLNGSDALDFVRYRHTDSDLYRVARQQAFVKAFKDQVSQSFSIKKVPKLVHAITSNVEVGQSGHRQMYGKT